MTDHVDAPRVLSDRYELSHLIARGGMAEVYRARDRLLDRPVALKILFPELSVDRSFVERFRREAQAAANLSHPNIVPVFDWGEDGGTYYIVMEFVDGRTLSSILRTAGELHPDRAAEIAADVAGALSYAHKRGVVHRDVKPGNVLITEEGVVKVTDFGIARALNTEESLTQTGAVMGTATYFSPEQAEGVGVDARSDIYSLGVVLFEMVTGRPPFLGDTPVSVASKHVREHPPTPREINPAIPADFEAIILKCMAKSPEHRYATGDELRADLLRFREGRSVLATIPPVALGATQAMGAVGRTATVPQVRPEPLAYEERTSNRTGIYAAILILLLAALAVVIIFLGQSLGWWHLGSSSSSTVTVPNLAGRSLSYAEAKLQGEGLNFTTQQDPLSNAPNTQVLRTVPGAGTKLKKGQSVKLVTGSKAKATDVTVPNLVNQSVSVAMAQLQSLGLQNQVQNVNTCSQQNIVCDTSPKPGTQVPKNSVVILYTAQTPTTTSGSVPVPNVTGDSQSAACNEIGLQGLVCGQTTNQYSSTVAQGNVVATEPPAGTPIARGSTVGLVISNGSPPIVPGLVGDTYSAAKSSLRSDGLTGVSDGSCLNNTDLVTSQSPAAGEPAPNSGQVTLTCSSATTSTTASGLLGGGGGGGNGQGHGHGATSPFEASAFEPFRI
jgi:serine/threonine protein kinase